MGYRFEVISKEKPITNEDYEIALGNLSKFNREGLHGEMPCDVELHKSGHYVAVSGSFGLSGKHAEGFVLNLLLALQDLGYIIKVVSHDFEYGSKEDCMWVENLNN